MFKARVADCGSKNPLTFKVTEKKNWTEKEIVFLSQAEQWSKKIWGLIIIVSLL